MTTNLCTAARLSALLIALLAVARAGVPCLTESINDVSMTAAVPGTVAAIHQGEGDFVEAGTVMLELESRTEQLDVERGQVRVETLQAELARSEKLLQGTSSISREEVDKTRGEYRVAVIELDLAREALAKRRLVAPFSGVITLLPVQVGDYCQPPRLLVRIVDARQFYAVANVEPDAAAGLALGGVVRLETGPESGPEKYAGKIVFISPVVDPASGLLRVKAIFDNPGGRLRPGVAGRLHLR